MVGSSNSLLEFPWVRIVDLCLYLHEVEFIIKRVDEKKSLAVTFNSIFWDIDDVLFINNNQFNTSVDSLYPNELEIKYTIRWSTYASYLDT
jgi:hypothetical protein